MPSEKRASATTPAQLRSVLSAYQEHADRFKFATRKLAGLERSYHVFGGLGFEEYLLLGPTETTGLWFVVKAASHDEQLALRFLRQLEARHSEVFAVQLVWKLRLDEPIGALDHAVVLAPEAARVAKQTLAYAQLFQAMPIHDCEFRGDESALEAGARTRGRGCIPHSTWNRPAHPVLDMRLQSSATKSKAKVLVYSPDQLAPIVRRLDALPQRSSLEVRNYRGETCRVTRAETLEVQLPGEAPPQRLAIEDVIAQLDTFIRK